MPDSPPVPCVLVADDQPDVVAALRLVLRDGGFDTDSASSIEGVRERLAARDFDLLLMDLNYARDTTSGREGLDLLAEVHARNRTLPIIVMTGWGGIETAVEAMRLGARSFVHKPWDNTTLTATVRREVDEGRALRQADASTTREIEHAQVIQKGLLPSSLPEVSGCEMAALWQPASSFGGDCYDAWRFGDAHVGVAIADVAGKGLPAALLMATMQASLRAFAQPHASCEEVTANVNRSLCRNARLSTCVTFFYGVMDCASRTMHFTNAGHNPPILARAGGAVERLGAGGLLLGAFADTRFEHGQVALQPGDRLLLFTDGITEALGPDGAEFGDERLVHTVRTLRHDRPQALADGVLATVRQFTGADAFSDDATLLCAAIA